MKKHTTVSLLKQWWHWYAIEHQLLLRQPVLAQACLKQCEEGGSPVLAAFDNKNGLSVDLAIRKKTLEMLRCAHQWSPALRLTPIFFPAVSQPVLRRCRSVVLNDSTRGRDYAWAKMLMLIYQRRQNCVLELAVINRLMSNTGQGNESSPACFSSSPASGLYELDLLMAYFERHPQLLTEGRPFPLLKQSMISIQRFGIASLIDDASDESNLKSKHRIAC